MDEQIVEYNSSTGKSLKQASVYKKTTQTASRYLAYRDIPDLIKKYAVGKIALDYGCGTGISTQFLVSLGLTVTGVDVSPAMIEQAKANCSFANLNLYQPDFLMSGQKYDLIFSSYVLFELSTRKEIATYLSNAKKMLNQDGVFLAVTGSQELYSRNWHCFRNNYPENKDVRSGKKARVFMPDANIEFTDYYWTEDDYRHAFKVAGLDILEVHYPLGKKTEAFSWRDELQYSPFVIFVAKSH